MNNLNKNSQFDTTSEIIKWIPKIIVIVIVVSTVFFLITIPVRQSFQIDKLQQTILRQRFVYSDSCLADENENIITPGIIDKVKFNSKNLENCFQANDNTGVSLTLKTDNDIETINLNQRLTDKFNFCFDIKHFSCNNYTYYVLIKDKNEIKPGFLNIRMIKIK